MEWLAQIKCHPHQDHVKGKYVLESENFPSLAATESSTGDIRRWVPPPPGWCKLNTDGSLAADGSAGAGMVLRDHMGTIVFTSCRKLLSCTDALEAELFAAMEGISLIRKKNGRYFSSPAVVQFTLHR